MVDHILQRLTANFSLMTTYQHAKIPLHQLFDSKQIQVGFPEYGPQRSEPLHAEHEPMIGHSQVKTYRSRCSVKYASKAVALYFAPSATTMNSV